MNYLAIPTDPSVYSRTPEEFWCVHDVQRGTARSQVADQIAETLAAVGVQHIYGIVGDSLNGLTDASRRLPA
jgi:hypothetical protein